MIRLIYSAFAAVLFWGVTTCIQNATSPIAVATKDQLIKAADLQVDAGVLREAFAELHPGLYRYHTKAGMDANFAALQSKLAHDLSLHAARISCEH
jgi:hypothetical protein